MFIGIGQLSAALQATLQKSQQENLAEYWPILLNQALTRSYWEIVQRLGQRGYSQTLVNQWDRGAEFQQDLGVWSALQWISTQTTVKVEQASLNLVDRRSELSGSKMLVGGREAPSDPVMVTVNGVMQYPDTTVGQPTTGPIEGGGPIGYPYELPAQNGNNFDNVIPDQNFAGPTSPGFIGTTAEGDSILNNSPG